MLVRRRGKKLHPQLAVLSVELPGIEPAPKNGLTCGNANVDYAKVAKLRETTCGYAEKC